MGALFRVGHQAGKTIGLNESITHLEAMPYLFTHTKNPDDAGMLFGNFRLFRTNRGNLGEPVVSLIASTTTTPTGSLVSVSTTIVMTRPIKFSSRQP